MTGARHSARSLAITLAALIAACGPNAAPTFPGPATTAPHQGSVLIGTTTSTQDAGLLDVLIPDFERRTGWRAKLVVGGSGQILTQAARGDLDVILTHSPAEEELFVKAGYATDRRLVMHNDFILVGAASDPAKVKGLSVSGALRAIAGAGSAFVSRGDKSGTNVKEQALWTAAGIDPNGRPWYIESGAGQLQSLQLAATRRAYTFTDRGTWVANAKTLQPDLVLLVEGGASLLNIYHVIVLDKARFPKVEDRGAKAFADYVVGTDGQAIIASYGVLKFGQSTFTADAGKNEADLE